MLRLHMIHPGSQTTKELERAVAVLGNTDIRLKVVVNMSSVDKVRIFAMLANEGVLLHTPKHCLSKFLGLEAWHRLRKTGAPLRCFASA